MSRLQRFRRPAAGVLLACLATTVPFARGQEPPATVIDEWRLLEPAQEMIDYKAKLKDGMFDDTSKTFVVTTVLPQLALPKNRATIDRVRRRIREVVCGDAGGDQKAAIAATQVIAEFMTALARDGKADPVVRVNAMLLVGELVGQARKPWTPAVAPLVAAVGDASLPPAVRIAAAAGLARHVDADAAARAADVGPAAVALVNSPLAGVDPVAADWLRSRSLTMLAGMGDAAPAGAAAAAAKLLLDGTRPVDVRVRAAAAVGRTVKAPGDTDVAAVVAAIRGLATATLAATQAETDRRALATRLAGGRGDQPPPQPLPALGAEAEGLEPTGDTQRYRRDAWRLATLADALATVDGDGGLARVAGATAPAVKELADALRQSAQGLDAQPDAQSLAAAIDALAGDGRAPSAPAAGGQNGQAQPATPATEPAGAEGVPFGDR